MSLKFKKSENDWFTHRILMTKQLCSIWLVIKSEFQTESASQQMNSCKHMLSHKEKLTKSHSIYAWSSHT